MRTIMKGLCHTSVWMLVLGMLAGCATSFPQGAFYTELSLPVTQTSNAGIGAKIGTAQCQSFLGLVAMGDCSIEKAKANGSITKVYHIDWEAKNILGIIGNYKLVVHGE